MTDTEPTRAAADTWHVLATSNGAHDRAHRVNDLRPDVYGVVEAVCGKRGRVLLTIEAGALVMPCRRCNR